MNARVTLTLLLVVGSAPSARAQTILPTAALERPHQVSLGLALDHGLITELAYTHALQLSALRLTAFGRLAAPAVPELEDGEVEAGMAAHLVHPTGWGAGARSGLRLTWVHSDLFAATQLGMTLRVEGGYFWSTASVVVTAAWQGALLTRLAPTERHRETARAPGGVFVGHTGGTLRAGIAGSLLAARRILFGLEAGLVSTEALEAVPGFPFYTSLTVGAVF